MADNMDEAEKTQLQESEKDHIRALNALAIALTAIYGKHITKLFLRLSGFIPRNAEKPFLIDRHPLFQKILNEHIDQLIREIEVTTSIAVKEAWERSNKKNDNWIMRLFKSNNPPDYLLEHNQSALRQFLARKTAGFTLSERVWRLLKPQILVEIESGIQTMIADGIPAARMATQMKQYLNNPDALFRRVRDQYGNLVLSKRAKAFHPGQGVYRSAYKNALRLTRSETNMSYRSADFERWKKMNFILGIEIKLSGNHPVRDLCDDLAGVYPKDFKFRAWHPACRCFAVPIRAGDEQMDSYFDHITSGGNPEDYEFTGHIKEPPAGLNTWLNENRERVAGWKHEPFFIKDNPKFTAVI